MIVEASFSSSPPSLTLTSPIYSELDCIWFLSEFLPRVPLCNASCVCVSVFFLPIFKCNILHRVICSHYQKGITNSKRIQLNVSRCNAYANEENQSCNSYSEVSVYITNKMNSKTVFKASERN